MHFDNPSLVEELYEECSNYIFTQIEYDKFETQNLQDPYVSIQQINRIQENILDEQLLDTEPVREKDIKLTQENNALLDEIQEFEEMGIQLPNFVKFKNLVDNEKSTKSL